MNQFIHFGSKLFEAAKHRKLKNKEIKLDHVKGDRTETQSMNKIELYVNK